LSKTINTLFVKIAVSILIIPGFNQCLYSQIKSDSLKEDSIVKLHKKNKLKDIIDVYKRVVNGESVVDDTSSKKKKIYVAVIPAAGYTMATGLTGVIASNISFYLDTNKTKLSIISASADYSQYNQYWGIINSYIADDNLKLKFIGDWRIYKFPTCTYGLGGYNTVSDAYHIDFAYLKLHEVVVHAIFPNTFLGLGYHLDYHWEIETESGPENIYQQITAYGINTVSNTSGFSVNVRFDNRENPINPGNGVSATIQLRNNLELIGSDFNSKSLLIDVRKYFQLPFESENVLAFWTYNNFTVAGKLPYLDLPSTGWDTYDNTGRGYVQGRFRGANFVYLESEYRFKITGNGLFGGVVFANAESLTEYPSNKFDTVLFAKGIGLRIKVNKITKSNLAIDYGFGQGKSHGLFLNLGEVF
jgi:outer membrane protein assembly factor BamA